MASVWCCETQSVLSQCVKGRLTIALMSAPVSSSILAKTLWPRSTARCRGLNPEIRGGGKKITWEATFFFFFFTGSECRPTLMSHVIPLSAETSATSSLKTPDPVSLSIRYTQNHLPRRLPRTWHPHSKTPKAAQEEAEEHDQYGSTTWCQY